MGKIRIISVIFANADYKHIKIQLNVQKGLIFQIMLIPMYLKPDIGSFYRAFFVYEFIISSTKNLRYQTNISNVVDLFLSHTQIVIIRFCPQFHFRRRSAQHICFVCASSTHFPPTTSNIKWHMRIWYSPFDKCSLNIQNDIDPQAERTRSANIYLTARNMFSHTRI